MSSSGGGFRYFPRLLFLYVTLFFAFFHASGVNSFCFMVSSALIPLLSGDLPFVEFVDCNSQLFCRDLWDSHHLIGVVVMHIDAAHTLILTDFLFSFFLFFVVVF